MKDLNTPIINAFNAWVKLSSEYCPKGCIKFAYTGLNWQIIQDAFNTFTYLCKAEGLNPKEVYKLLK